MSEDAPEGSESTFALLRAAYPQGLPDEDYLPLLRLLIDHMSERRLGETIGILFEREAVVVQSDSAAAQSVRQPSSSDMERVRQRLETHGYDAWVRGS